MDCAYLSVNRVNGIGESSMFSSQTFLNRSNLTTPPDSFKHQIILENIVFSCVIHVIGLIRYCLAYQVFGNRRTC